MRMKPFFFFQQFFFLVWPCACHWGSSGAWWSSWEATMICSLCPASPHLLIPLPSTYSSGSGFRWCCCTWPVSYSPPAMTGVSPKSNLNKTYLIQNLNVREVHQPYVPLLPGWEPLNRSLRHGGLLYLSACEGLDSGRWLVSGWSCGDFAVIRSPE